MIVLKILNMKNFLQVVNSCKGMVYLLHPDGKKENIKGQEKIQNDLWRAFRDSKNYLKLSLEIPTPGDYMSIVSYYAGDC